MEQLKQRIRDEGVYLGDGIIKVDGFLNHQIDPQLIMAVGQAFQAAFADSGATKILTAESSGIAPAMAAGLQMGLPVIYARKKTPLTMSDTIYKAEAPSRTKGGVVPLMVSPDYLFPEDRVLIIDDFLATGLTLVAMGKIIRQSGASLVGIGCVIEKVFEPGRSRIAEFFSGPVVTLAKVDVVDSQLLVT